MIEGIDAGLELVALLPTLGVPVLLVLFYLDGMVIGKFLPPAAVFVAYVVLVQPPPTLLVLVSLAAVLASTLGQWTLYRGLNDHSPEFFGLRRRLPYVDRIPMVIRGGVGKQRMTLVTRVFHRLGGLGITVFNALPGVRSLLTIPAGLSRYPVDRFLVFSMIGNVIYVAVLVAVSLGTLEALAFLPVPGCLSTVPTVR